MSVYPPRVSRDSNPPLAVVTAGKHYNGGCCFDYGNAEVDARDHGAGTMEAIYWGNSCGLCKGSDKGPWVMADLENGLWGGNEHVSPGNHPIVADFVTAMVKGDSGNHFALKGGDATTGTLTVLYDGVRPNGYHPMKKQVYCLTRRFLVASVRTLTLNNAGPHTALC